MELTGRTYIFAAATLLILAAALKVYDDYADTPQGQYRLRALKMSICEKVGVGAVSLRFGCHPDLIRAETGARPKVRRGAGDAPLPGS